MVVVVVTRDRRGWRGGDASMSSRNLVRLAGRSVATTAPAIPSSCCGGALSLSRAAGGRPLRAASPPPPASVASTACWDSRTLRSDGEDWEEVVVAVGDADFQEATEEHGVVFGVAPTEEEVRAAVASIKQPAGEIAIIVDGVDIISDSTHSSARGQSFSGTSANQIWPRNTFYWHLSDPLVDLLGSIHENMSEAGSRRNSFFPVFNSFSFPEHEHTDEHRGGNSDQQTREAYSTGEVNSRDGLRAPLLSQAASVEVNDTNTSFTSEGSSSNLRRHGTSTLAQEFMTSLHDYDIEEEEIQGMALPHQPAYRDMESTGRLPSRNRIVRLSETADMKSKWRVLLQPGVRHALCYGMLIQALQQSAGISVLLRHAPEILEQVGVVGLFLDIGLSPHSTSILICALNALLMLPCITAAMLLMDVCGRRALFLATTPILMLSLSVMSLSTMANMGSLARAILFHLASTICFCSYVVGLGPIPNILCSEMFPTKARATCVSFCSLSFWFGGLLSAYCFPVMLSTIGLGGACGIYALVCCIPLFLVYYQIPEMKRVDLEFIAELFQLSRQEYVQ